MFTMGKKSVSKGILSMITERDTQTTVQTPPVNPMIIEKGNKDPFYIIS
jgi:hypothetical protein